ncbi:MAG: type II 3-dehydroquinate dehydratase [Gemmatimonadetes bacterium]|nr:type II 3-dehydroquinate dehydratase [Gemmatimonadota bacterium]
MRVGVINGPNLNLLGTREPSLYGGVTLDQVETLVRAEGRSLGVDIEWAQSNVEGELVNAIQRLGQSCEGLILNAGAYTHTSLAIRDAVAAVAVPTVEVHLSNIFGREAARRQTVLADAVIGVIAGFGSTSYLLGLRALYSRLARA